MKSIAQWYAIPFFAFAALTAFAFRANSFVQNPDEAWRARHEAIIAAAADNSVPKNIVFLGDGQTRRWETTGAGALEAQFTGDRAMFNLGFDGDRTEHVLWRIAKGGELDGYAAKAIFLMVGGNNSADFPKDEEGPALTIVAIRDILSKIREKQPGATIVLQAILPRGKDEGEPLRSRNDMVNRELRKFADARDHIVWCDMTDLFLEGDHHTLKASLFNDDLATLNAAGYEVWAKAVSGYIDAAVSGAAMPAGFVAAARPGMERTTEPEPCFPVTRPVDPANRWDQLREDLNELRKNGGGDFDLVLLGDSITDNWGWMARSAMDGLSDKYGGVVNLGIGGDRTEHLLWRLENGCLDGYKAKFFFLLIGTNNSFQKNPCDKPEDVAAAIRRILDDIAEKHPESKVLLMSILPYEKLNDEPRGATRRANNEAVNALIAKYADGKSVIWLDVRDKFLNADGSFKADMYSEKSLDGIGHFLHPSPAAYKEIIVPAVKDAIK